MADNKMYTFTVIDGEHEGLQKTYKKGDTFRSQYPLDEMFTGKFLRGADIIMVDAKKAPDTRMMFVFSDAVDITEKFPIASENELRVFKDAMGGHAVASALASDIELTNLAPTIMGTAKQVNTWLVAYAKRQEQE